MYTVVIFVKALVSDLCLNRLLLWKLILRQWHFVVIALLQFMKFVVPTKKAVEVDNRISDEDKNEAYIQKLMGIPEENFERLDE